MCGLHAPAGPPPAGRGSSIRLALAFCVTPSSVTPVTVRSEAVALVSLSSILASILTTHSSTVCVAAPISMVWLLLIGMPPSGSVSVFPLTPKAMASKSGQGFPSSGEPMLAMSMLANE